MYISRLLIISHLFLLNICFADSVMPIYSDGILTVPSVDTHEAPGIYQDIIFRLSEQGQWQIVAGNISEFLPVDTVELIKTNTFPVQVLLKISGTLPSLCDRQIGQIRHRLSGNTLEVFLYVYDVTRQQGCFSSIDHYTTIIPLPVYSLNKGEYHYRVNNRLEGSFSLIEDNVLIPDDSRRKLEVSK